MNYSEKEVNPTSLDAGSYFLQHQSNFMRWSTWSEATLRKAESENKMLFVSVGYSACIWCMKMSRLAFDKPDVADYFNRHFITVLIDKDEHPELSAYYSNALQILNQNVGWPISCFTLPTGAPVFGFTYLPPDQLLDIAEGMVDAYSNNRSEVEAVAGEVEESIALMRVVNRECEGIPTRKDIHLIVEPWRRKFDPIHGGTMRPPKFPLAGGKEFLQEYAYYFDDKEVKSHLLLTLDSMAKGAIYDQINGAFFRYSTDVAWNKPHFEKLLGDNAQLIKLYCQAYKSRISVLYEKVIVETLQRYIRVMAAPDGGFYTSLMASADGIDGLYYTWTKEELGNILGREDMAIAESYYGLKKGDGSRGVLYIKTTLQEASKKLGIGQRALAARIKMIREQLSEVGASRALVALNRKIIIYDNASMVVALLMAYQALANDGYLFIAQETLDFLYNHLQKENGTFYRYYENDKAQGEAFLDDYAMLINALIHMFFTTGEERYANEAKRLTDYTISEFFDKTTRMFLYCPIADGYERFQTMPVADGSVPSAGSIMAHNLWYMGNLFHNQDYLEKVNDMLCNIRPQMAGSGPYSATWGQLLFRFVFKQLKVAIVGPNAADLAKELHKYYLPNLILAYTEKESQLPFFKSIRFEQDYTKIYLLEEGKAPIEVKDIDTLKDMAREKPPIC